MEAAFSSEERSKEEPQERLKVRIGTMISPEKSDWIFLSTDRFGNNGCNLRLN